MKRTLPAAASLLALVVSGCDGEERGKIPKDSVANQPPSSYGDAAVDYKGPTLGGEIPKGPELEPPAADNGPFEVSDECCNRTLSVPAAGDEQSVRVVGNLPPLDGAGKAAALSGGSYSVDACMPVSVAVQYRFEIDVAGDGGTTTAYRTDPTQPTVEDENGGVWNVSAIASCDDAGT